jgi:hypothetical protein
MPGVARYVDRKRGLETCSQRDDGLAGKSPRPGRPVAAVPDIPANGRIDIAFTREGRAGSRMIRMTSLVQPQ